MPVPEQQAPIARQLLRDAAYATLRSAILDGTLAPGERLREPELCEWLKLSKTPVREALARLEDEGLIETAPQRYTRVAPLDRKEARDTFELVAAIHALAARRAVPRVGDAEVERMRDANRRFAAALEAGDVDEAVATDDAFHDVLIQASGNGEIASAIARLMPRLRRLERMRFGSLVGRGSVRQHEEIASAAARGDAEATARALEENWLSLSVLLDRLLADGREPQSTPEPQEVTP